MPENIAMSTYTSALNAIFALHRNRPGALLPILHAIQDAWGYVPAQTVPLIARELNLSRAEVHGVLTYYPYFRQTPVGRHVVRICRAEGCQAVGADALADHAQQTLGCGFHETTTDGEVTLEPVYCLGQCAVGPALQIDETILHARVTAEKFDVLMAGLGDRS
jgi:formate dehydrogenase subunit gamma